MSIRNLFCTPVYETILSHHELTFVQPEIAKCVDKINFYKKEGWVSSEFTLSDPTFNSSVIEEFNLNALKGVIDTHLLFYLPRLRHNRYAITKSWITKSVRGEWSHKHDHGGDVSGVYYYNTSGRDGKLHLFNPCRIRHDYVFDDGQDFVEIEPCTGKLLLFPSWLEHGVTENLTDSTRISLSFNITFERII